MKRSETYEAKIPPEIGPIIYIHICLMASENASKRAGTRDLIGFKDAPDKLKPVKISIIKVTSITKPVKLLKLFCLIVDSNTTVINPNVNINSQHITLI